MEQILLSSSNDIYTLTFNAATRSLVISGVNNYPLVKDSIAEAYDVTAAGYIDLSQNVFTWYRSNGLPIYVYVFCAVPGGAGNSDTLNLLLEVPSHQKEFSLQQKQASASAGTAGTLVNGETPSGTIDGANKTFTLIAAPIVGAVTLIYTPTGEVSQLLNYGTDFTVSGSTLTLNTAPATESSLIAIYNH